LPQDASRTWGTDLRLQQQPGQVIGYHRLMRTGSQPLMNYRWFTW
jgi:hypothetical protein